MTPTDSYVIPKGFIAILSFAFAVEGALYSAVTPILPLLSRRFDLTDTIAGVLLSSSSTGHVAGSLIRVLILARSNARDVAVGAMAALAITTILFAWADTSTISLWARHCQGVAAGIACTACILWLLSAWPIVRRGAAWRWELPWVRR